MDGKGRAALNRHSGGGGEGRKVGVKRTGEDCIEMRKRWDGGSRKGRERKQKKRGILWFEVRRNVT